MLLRHHFYNSKLSLSEMTQTESHQDVHSVIEKIDSNASTCSTRTNLSRSVELTLYPLIEQLVSSDSRGVPGVKSVRSPNETADKPVSALLQALDQSVGRLAQVAEEIAYEENGIARSGMLSAVHRLKGSARQLRERVVSSPVLNSCEDENPGQDVTVREVSRALLYDLASVLSVADKLDGKRLVETSLSVENCLEKLKHAVSVQELYQHIRQFTPVMAGLTKLARQRQEELGVS